MRLDIYHHTENASEFLEAVNRLSSVLSEVLTQQEIMMATLDEVLADVTDESTQLDSLSALVSGLQKQVADALANTSLPPDVQAKVDAIFAAAESNRSKIATALAANTPAASPTTTG